MNFVPLIPLVIKDENREHIYHMYGPPAFPGNYNMLRNPNNQQPTHQHEVLQQQPPTPLPAAVQLEQEYSPPLREGETRKETLQKGRERERSRRLNETIDAREERLKKGRERERLRRMNETPEERQERLRKNCERQRKRRQYQKEREETEKTDLPPSPPVVTQLKYPPNDNLQFPFMQHHHLL